MASVITLCGHQELLKTALIFISIAVFRLELENIGSTIIECVQCVFDGLCCWRINAFSKKGRDFSGREASETCKALISGMLLTTQSPQGIQWKLG